MYAEVKIDDFTVRRIILCDQCNCECNSKYIGIGEYKYCPECIKVIDPPSAEVK